MSSIDHRWLQEAQRLQAEFRQLEGRVIAVRLNEYRRLPHEVTDPESVTLIYDNGKEVTIHGGGDYCASTSVSVVLERSPNE